MVQNTLWRNKRSPISDSLKILDMALPLMSPVWHVPSLNCKVLLVPQMFTAHACSCLSLCTPGSRQNLSQSTFLKSCGITYRCAPFLLFLVNPMQIFAMLYCIVFTFLFSSLSNGCLFSSSKLPQNVIYQYRAVFFSSYTFFQAKLNNYYRSSHTCNTNVNIMHKYKCAFSRAIIISKNRTKPNNNSSIHYPRVKCSAVLII